MKRPILITLVAFNVAAFAQKTITVKVKENTVPCEGLAPMDCMQVKEGSAKSWSNFYSAIEGFDYQPGYQYKLKVIKTKRTGNTPADASAYTYQLKKVVYKKKMPNSNTTAFYLNKKMVLVQLNGKKNTSGKVYLTLDGDRHTISGKSGCSRFNATYKQLAGSSIELSLLMGTMMACDQESMQLEQEFTTAIDKKKFEIHADGNTVHFKDAQTKNLVMIFNIPAENEIWSFIDGKEWKLIQMDHTAKDYGKARIRFDVNTKKVNGNGGCNNFFGTYTSENDQISFSALGSTKIACADKEVAGTEINLLNHLSGTTLRFDLAEQTLNFYKGDQLVMMFGVIQ